MAQVTLARGEFDMRAHECGQPWDVYSGSRGLTLAGMRFGYDGAQVLMSVVGLPFVLGAVFVCRDCDVLLIGVGTDSPRYLSQLDQAARSLEEFATR